MSRKLKKPYLMNLFADNKSRDYGLLLLRVGVGLMFVTIHGFPKITGGMQNWTVLGKTFNRIIGISFIPVFWGFMAAIAEFGGGIFLIIGILFRPAWVERYACVHRCFFGTLP